MATNPLLLEAPVVAPVDTVAVILALKAVCGDVGCDWLSSTGEDRETDLTEVCGGSGWYGRPKKDDDLTRKEVSRYA